MNTIGEYAPNHYLMKNKTRFAKSEYLLNIFIDSELFIIKFPVESKLFFIICYTSKYF